MFVLQIGQIYNSHLFLLSHAVGTRRGILVEVAAVAKSRTVEPASTYSKVAFL